jgi:hypothetical protein
VRPHPTIIPGLVGAVPGLRVVEGYLWPGSRA